MIEAAMKRMFILLYCLCIALVGYSQRYDSEQEKLGTEIADYLQRQGLNPEKQKDGLKFKSEGSTYYIEIDENEKNPMYVCLRRYVKYSDRYDRQTISDNLNAYNVKYGVKVFCQENSFVMSAEMFLDKASDFNYVFDTFLSHIQSTYELITE